MKSYRFFGEEAEVLGQRLDAARQSLASAKSKWAQQYWQLAVDRLLFQWRQLPILHDGDAQVTIIPRWTIKYDFYEKNTSYGYGISDRAFDAVFRTEANLDASWHRARETRLACSQ